MSANTILVLGATGKTGRRVAERLRARDLPIRPGSRSGEPPLTGRTGPLEQPRSVAWRRFTSLTIWTRSRAWQRLLVEAEIPDES